jgi:predicted ABC-type ATPase
MVSRYENAEKVEKHGDHDQSSHGAWATGQGSQEVRERRAKSGKVPGMTRDASGNVSNPDATGGHKAKIPREVSIGKDAKGNDIMIDESHSMWHHMVPDGKGGFEFSEERQALHEQIIDELVSGVPKSENPTLYMLGGGPASGKSTFLNSGATDVPSGSSAVQINADTIKERLPEYERMVKGPDSDFFNAAQFSHEESSMLAKEVQRRAIALGKDIVLDGTGDSAIGKLASKVEQARQQGYTVKATYVTIPTETAVERANKRALGSSARYVPSEIVRETHRAVSDTFDLALKGNLFDSVTLWDNTTKGAPKLLATGNTKGYEIKDQAGYKSFLDKRDEKK